MKGLKENYHKLVVYIGLIIEGGADIWLASPLHKASKQAATTIFASETHHTDSVVVIRTMTGRGSGLFSNPSYEIPKRSNLNLGV
jgi:hypothetical protein